MSSNIKLGNSSVSTIGRFKLDVNRDKNKFAITNINSFVPKGKTAQDRMKFLTPSGAVDALIIHKISTTFKPDSSEIDKHNIEVLIQHHDVMLAGMTQKEYAELVRLGYKKSNPKFTLTNLDRVETESFDNEVELIQARALLYSAEKPISKERLVWLSSNFGIPYRSQITDEKRYKIQLSKGIDAFIQRSKENRNAFLKAMKDIRTTEMIFYINELKNLEVIVDIGGLYKVGDRPIGATDDHIINFYDENNELFLHHQKMVKDNLAGTIMS